MTIGTYTLSAALMVVLAIGIAWLLSLIAVLFVDRRRSRVLAGATSVAFAGAWLFSVVSVSDASAKSSVTSAAATRSCATVATGDKEQTVRSYMGTPSETRGEEELRGPGATVWIYRDSRCAVHFLDGVVESVD